jgi:hypothetical protein
MEQFDVRELHLVSQLRTRELEVQHYSVRFEQQRKAAENEASRSRTLSGQVSTFSQTETELRSQLNIYVEKFKQVGRFLTILTNGRHRPRVLLSFAFLTLTSFFRWRILSTTRTNCSSHFGKRWRRCQRRRSV